MMIPTGRRKCRLSVMMVLFQACCFTTRRMAIDGTAHAFQVSVTPPGGAGDGGTTTTTTPIATPTQKGNNNGGLKPPCFAIQQLPLLPPRSHSSSSSPVSKARRPRLLWNNIPFSFSSSTMSSKDDDNDVDEHGMATSLPSDPPTGSASHDVTKWNTNSGSSIRLFLSSSIVFMVNLARRLALDP